MSSFSLELHRQGHPITTKGIQGGQKHVVVHLFDLATKGTQNNSLKTDFQHYGSGEGYKKLTQRIQLSEEDGEETEPQELLLLRSEVADQETYQKQYSEGSTTTQRPAQPT